jgi:hypothetical protein
MRLYGKLAKQELQTRHDEIDGDEMDDLSAIRWLQHYKQPKTGRRTKVLRFRLKDVNNNLPLFDDQRPYLRRSVRLPGSEGSCSPDSVQ